MRHTLEDVQKSLQRLQNGSQMETYRLYPGIELSFIEMRSSEISLSHGVLNYIFEINYCKAGRIGWNMGSGSNVYLGPGDFSINTMDACANSKITLPNDYYEGFALCVDLHELSKRPPEPLADAGLRGELLYDKFCKDRAFTSLAGNIESQNLFSAFYNQPKALQSAYWKLKALELLLYLYKIDLSPKYQLTEYQSEQVEAIRKIHEHLIQNIAQKITIEALSKQYLMNATTLKTVFKAVYGTSIASHIKTHRMEMAAALLRGTQDNLAHISQTIGYENQSKFTAAFKEHFKMLPTEYRKISTNRMISIL